MIARLLFSQPVLSVQSELCLACSYYDGSDGRLWVGLVEDFGLGQLAMRIHHGQQNLDVLVLFVRRLGLVMVHLLNLSVSDLEQDLLWLLHPQSLRRSCLLHDLVLDHVALQLRCVHHL